MLKLIIISVAGVILFNLYINTFSDPDFIGKYDSSFKNVLNFHKTYPVQLIGYIFLTLFPALYLSFFRGTEFYEKGIMFNNGFPFWNDFIKYEEIASYSIVHSKYLISIRLKESGSTIFFMIKNIDRAVAIFDQQEISGNLEASIAKRMTITRKLVVLFVIFGLVTSVMQYSGLIIWINRTLFR